MRHDSAGFTFIELLTVIIVGGILTAIMVKAVSGSFGSSSRRSASREVSAYLTRARTVAIQRSRTAWLVRNGNVLKILVDSSGTKVQLGTPIDLSVRYGVTVTATPTDTVQFDPRGFAANVTLTPKYIVARNGQADTLCVSGLGRVATRSCP